jgi:hypothetical protein
MLPVDAFEMDMPSLNIGKSEQAEPQGVVACLSEQARQGSRFLSH